MSQSFELGIEQYRMMKEFIDVRRNFIKSTGLGLLAASLFPMAYAQQQRGILNRQAPELVVPEWINGSGKQQRPFSIAENRGKWIYLKCFQEWCPACHSVGFPNLQKLMEAFPDDRIITKGVIQTTFEGFGTNTKDALRKNQLRYSLDLPFGHDAGNSELSRNNPDRFPKTMVDYLTGGTPWVVLINPDGWVVFNDFHINIDGLIDHLNKVA